MSSTANNGAAKLDFTTFHNIINGKLVSGLRTRHGLNPANKQPLAEVPIATEQDLDNAVAAARTAFKTWSRTTELERAAALNAFAAALQEHQDEFAKLLTTEQGKPVRASTSVTIDRRSNGHSLDCPCPRGAAFGWPVVDRHREIDARGGGRGEWGFETGYGQVYAVRRCGRHRAVEFPYLFGYFSLFLKR